MNLFSIKNTTNYFGNNLINYLSTSNQIFIHDKNNIKNITYKNFINSFKDENIFIFNSNFLSEKLTIKTIKNIIKNLNDIFKITKFLSKNLIEKNIKAKFYFFLLNQNFKNIKSFPYSPIYNESIITFIKTISKELYNYNIYFTGLSINPIYELLNINEIKNYKTSIKRTPIKINNLLKKIEIIFKSEIDFSGQILNI